MRAYLSINKNFLFKIFGALIIWWFFLSAHLLAHGVGTSIEREVGQYLVDIGYAPSTLTTGETVRFDFELFRKGRSEVVAFSDLWVRLSKEDKVFFAGGINHQQFGQTGLSLNLSEAGNYELFVRYNQSTSSLVELTTDFSVGGSEGILAMDYTKLVTPLLLMFFLGYFSLTIYKNYSPKLKVDNATKSVGVSRMTPISLRQFLGKVPKVNWANVKSIFINFLVIIISGVLAFIATRAVLTRFQDNNLANNEAFRMPVLGEVNIVLTDEGFSPREISVKTGTIVTFSNTTGRPYWPASNLHPSHELYPEFDPKRPLNSDETWLFTFDKVGDWNMHDHIRSYYTGTIHVLEN